MGILDFLNPQKMVTDAATNVADKVTGGGLGNIIAHPISSLLGGLGGMAKGVFNFGNLIGGGIRNALIIIGVQLLAPVQWAAAEIALLGPENAAKDAKRIKDGGDAGMVIGALEKGVALAAASGGVTGAIQGAGVNGPLPGIIGTVGVLGAVAVVALGKAHQNGMFMAENDASSKQPPVTPQGKTKAEQGLA